MKAMKAISRRLSSSDLNTLSYVARSRRIANAVKKGDLFFVDKLPPRDWRQSDWNYEVDRLQYNLTYSNSEQYCSEEFQSLARGREVTAENLEEEAVVLQTRAAKIAARASVLSRHWEAASLLREEVEYLEEEATRLFEAAADLRKQADYFYSEAEAVLEEEKYVSKWEEIYDLM